MNPLLDKVKKNLILEHDEDDELLEEIIAAAVDYAELYQHVGSGYYDDNDMPASTEQAVIMLSTFLYESRDGATGGYFSSMLGAADQAFETIHSLLRLNKDWVV